MLFKSSLKKQVKDSSFFVWLLDPFLTLRSRWAAGVEAQAGWGGEFRHMAVLLGSWILDFANLMGLYLWLKYSENSWEIQMQQFQCVNPTYLLRVSKQRCIRCIQGNPEIHCLSAYVGKWERWETLKLFPARHREKLQVGWGKESFHSPLQV